MGIRFTHQTTRACGLLFFYLRLGEYILGTRRRIWQHGVIHV
jgi:hypothetical protein